MAQKRQNHVAAVVVLWGALASCPPLYAQGDNYFGEGQDESGTATAQADASRASSVQNAVLEGVQLSSEQGEEADERIVTCYFIFRDKPTSYFYEAKPKENKIVFEFNDTQLGASPIPSMQEKPIQGFRVEPVKVDVNAEVKGLTPEWHDVVKVSFFLDAIPEIAVKDEYSVISFSFTWTTNPDKIKNYVQADESKKRKALLFSIGGGVGLAAAAGVIYYFLQPGPEENGPEDLRIDDLPQHPSAPAW
jgi:hypothetical protein